MNGIAWAIVALGIGVVVVRRRSIAVGFVTVQALLLAAAAFGEGTSVDAAIAVDELADRHGQAAERHRGEQCADLDAEAAAIAAHRDVEVVAQEPRQGHVPAPPELAERRRAVRHVEILRQHKSK